MTRPATQPSVTYGDKTYKVRGNPPLPDFSTMSRIAALTWLSRHTYARGHSRPNPLAGLGAVLKLHTPDMEDCS